MSYETVELPSDQPMQFVGVYVLQWSKVVSGEITEPTVGFVEVDTDDTITDKIRVVYLAWKAADMTAWRAMEDIGNILNGA